MFLPISLLQNFVLYLKYLILIFTLRDATKINLYYLPNNMYLTKGWRLTINITSLNVNLKIRDMASFKNVDYEYILAGKLSNKDTKISIATTLEIIGLHT